MKKIFLLCLTLLSCSRQQAQHTEHVVVVVIDGARYTETFGDSAHASIPRIWNQLRPLGTIYTAFSNDSLTLTIPGHSSIVTGTWQDLPNDGSVRPTSPTIFEYFRKQKDVDSTICWVALGKLKLNVLSHSTHAEYGSSYAASVRTSTSQYDDSIAWENTRYVLTTYHPSLTIVNLPETDIAGHSGEWDNYISAIQRVDTLVASLWNTIQANSVLHNKTTMIITNDHGRHTTDFTSHGDGCEGCRHIMLLVIGPDTPGGAVDSMSYSQIDIAPTIGAFMGFTTPYSTGAIIQSAIITSVSCDLSSSIRTFSLQQNYPNPFNPNTVISYTISDVGTRHAVSLRVYDLLGREVATLVNEMKPAGSYNVKWNATYLPSGIYFYQLIANGLVDVKKALLLK